MSTVGAVGRIGPLHLDVEYDARANGIRGPFDISALLPGTEPTYPVLWSHDAKREHTMAFEADSEGTPHPGVTTEERETVARKVDKIWATRSHCHFNVNFQFNSQSTGMQFARRASIGGRAWISVQLDSIEREKALVLWGNTSLGLLMHWWHANKQQAGRGNIGKAALRSMPTLDVTALTPDQIRAAARVFDDLCGNKLLPMHQMHKDPTRRELDERFAREVLGITGSVLAPDGPLEILRKKLSLEPSVRGGQEHVARTENNWLRKKGRLPT